jgi:diguanylate cyclase (GGDEF)-like protein/PAS domain S-box-containing protein
VPRNSENAAHAQALSSRGERHLPALAKLSAAASDIAESELRASIAALEAKVLSYEAAIETIAQGVCVFDAGQRLIHCNSRYLTLYGLAPEQAAPGATFREIAEQCCAVGRWAMTADHYLSMCASICADGEPKSFEVRLGDGRTMNVHHRPLPDGGWIATHQDVTELMASRAAARERVSLQALIDKVPDKLWVKDAASRFFIANAATASEYALPATIDLIGKTDFDLYPRETAEQFFAIEQAIIRSRQPSVDMDECIVDASGERRWLSTSKVPLLDDRNEPAGLLGISRDITDRKQADVLRNGQAEILEMIAMSAPLQGVLDCLIRLIESQLSGIMASVLLLDEDGVRLRHGAAPSLAKSYVEAIDGVAIGPKVGSCGTAAHRRETVVVSDITSDILWEDYRELAAAYGYRSCWSTPIFSHTGAVLGTFAMYSTAVREPAEPETSLIEVATRIAGIAIERKRAEDRIHFMANHDALTRLPNRSLLKDRLAEAAQEADRRDRWATVAFIDLDNFKDVNDSFGHGAGDELLKVVADRMLRCLKPTDTVVRLGGDEFVILLVDQPKSVDIIAATLEKIRTAIAAPIDVEGRNLQVMVSIGVANYPADGKDAETLIANADAAMYGAKDGGRDNIQFYAPALSAKARQ